MSIAGPLGEHVTVGYSPLVLIAEDEPEIAEVVIAYLKREGFRCVHVRDGRGALELHLAVKPDLVLLDVQMPLVDGWKVLSEIRVRGSTPVIMLTAMDQDIDKLTGLRIGADDYIVKPFNPAEVVARAQAVLRRSRPAELAQGARIVRDELFEVDVEQYRATVKISDRWQPLELTVTELKLLTKLVSSPLRVFSRIELLESCLPEGDTMARTVDSHVSKLRKKLEDLGVHGIPSSVRGVGYRLRE